MKSDDRNELVKRLKESFAKRLRAALAPYSGKTLDPARLATIKESVAEALLRIPTVEIVDDTEEEKVCRDVMEEPQHEIRVRVTIPISYPITPDPGPDE